MSAYYNEIDPFAAQWLRELIKAGLIADGEVDERSIADVQPGDVRGFTQCHFFAGIGGWSLALRLAGWEDHAAVWTGSCPCQPWSVAGDSQGTNDSRHLWPAWYRLVTQCRPAVLFGEQVASADGLYWLDLVYVDLEAAGYAVGAFDLAAAGVGAPHVRQRLWFVGHTDGARRETRDGEPVGIEPRSEKSADTGVLRNMADSSSGRQRINRRASRHARHIDECQPISELAVTNGRQSGDCKLQPGRQYRQRTPDGAVAWQGAEWIACTDGKARPVKPGTFPLAYGIPARMGRLRGYGNAIVPQVAQAFIESYLEATA